MKRTMGTDGKCVGWVEVRDPRVNDRSCLPPRGSRTSTHPTISFAALLLSLLPLAAAAEDALPVFTDVTAESGIDVKQSYGDFKLTNIIEGTGSGAAFFDADGDLDLYVLNYGPDVLYRNNGDGTFTDVTKQAGLLNPNGRAMSAAVADLNNDGRLDVYVTNDGMENFYHRNNGKGTFSNEALLTGLAFGEGGQGVSSMGPAVGDVDRDGRLDVYVPDMGYGCLLMNRGEYFEDRTAESKLAVVCGQYTGWGGLLIDYDNDGYLDVFIANGNAHHEYTEEDVLMRNDGTGCFIDVAAQSGDYFKQKYVGRGATYADYDNDGDLDLLVVNLNDSPRLLRNDGGNRNNWLKVAPKLPGGKSDALGARITVKTGSLTQIHDLIPVTGYLSQADPRAHFGLGKAAKADSVEIRWPNGQTVKLQDVQANRTLTVVQKEK